MQCRSFLGAELIVDHDHFHLGAVRQVGGLVQDQPAVGDLQLSRVHDCMVSLLGQVRTCSG